MIIIFFTGSTHSIVLPNDFQFNSFNSKSNPINMSFNWVLGVAILQMPPDLFIGFNICHVQYFYHFLLLNIRQRLYRVIAWSGGVNESVVNIAR